MTNATSDASRGGAVFWRLYMLSWVALAGAALIYLSAAIARPDLLKPLVSQSLAQSTTTDDVVSTKLETLERSLNSLENKIASVESEVRKVATATPLNTAPPQQTTATAPPDADADKVPELPQIIAKEPEKPVPQVAAVPRGKLPPLPSRAPERKQRVASAGNSADGPDIPLVILNGVAAAGIATGSVDRAQQATRSDANGAATQSRLPEIVKAQPRAPKAPEQPVIAFGNPTIEPSAPSVGTANSIVVSVAGSVNQLRANWDGLLARHPQLLGRLQPRYDIMAANGPFRLLAGPLNSKAEAGQLCSVLQLRGVTCDVEDNFLGNAL